ncbi:hypothetical protein HG536_0H04520 [Torulaspora globosa]|uniref:Uncharacterized protein n=1 Tax=Torulaspora globosa TaxID=48254 RepID=A0A7G3ZNJ0_9SACH|nr:uncharacterized protein HG536_0H04520 [Torulaspora globosa]QLL35076.1 hypothetical protein HG536_0H04520 [Torulaspora globosa]
MYENLKKRSTGSVTIQRPVAMISHEDSPADKDSLRRKARRLYTWDEIPEWQRDNEHILTGYVGETKSSWECFKSLFYLHNESINIYSHLMPGIAFFFILFFNKFAITKFETTSFIDYFMIDLFFVGAFTCLTLSSIFHCLKNHSLSVATFGNKLDYLGIVVLIVNSMISIMYYGFHESPSLFYFFTVVTCSFGLACAVVSMKERFRTREWRPYRAALFVAFGLSAVLPIIAGSIHYGFSELYLRIQVKWVLLGGIFYIVGAVLYGMRFPEKCSPGRFDIWGHSHQLFHILVVVAALCHLNGLIKSYDLVHLKMAMAPASSPSIDTFN